MSYLSSAYRLTQSLAILVLIGLATAKAASTAEPRDKFIFSAVPDWVEPAKFEKKQISAPDGVYDGLYYLLVDRQTRISEDSKTPTANYSHYRYLLANTEGLESGSSISIDFDPSYEQLKVHSVSVWRDGVAQQRLQSASYQILNRESERENLLYNGELSLDIVLSDTRTGDVVEYSYTIEGSNPVYAGLNEYGFKLNWNVPVQQVLYRVLTPTDTPLEQRHLAGEQSFTMTSNAQHNEYRYQASDIHANDADVNERIVLSDVKQWADITEWSLPLYQKALRNSEGVDGLAAKIAKEHSSTEARIGAALNWTQSNIRYLGIEYGTNSHNPSPAQETLQRRYGDCKDKAVLLIALLNQMDINAEPALVYSGEHTPLNKSPYRLHAFNHVIVHLEHDNTSHWLDPTLNYQKGALGEFSEPDYGRALVIKNGTDKLALMATDVERGKTSVTKKIEFSQGHATMEVATLRTKAEAENHRKNLSQEGVKSTSDRYFDYYKKSFKDLAQDANLKVEDKANNQILTTELYSFPYDPKEGGANQSTWARADDIATSIFEIDEAESGDFIISEPESIDEKIHIQYDQAIIAESTSQHIENDYFSFDFKQEVDAKIQLLTLDFSYAVKQKQVPAEELSDLQKDTDKIIDILYLNFNSPLVGNKKTNLGPVATSLKKWSDSILIGVFITFAVIYLYACVEWLVDRRKPQVTGFFYPVSPKKFWLMSFTTVGLYSVFYLYRTFRYSRDSLSFKIWPAVCAVFSGFFLYSAYKHVRSYAAKHQGSVQVGLFSSVLLALVYLILTLVSSNFMPVLLSLGATACIYPLHRWVNALNSEDLEAYRFNSRIRPRHILLMVLSPFLFLFTIPSELNLLPSEEVVSEWQVWGFQKDFMTTHNILEKDDSLKLFYSSSTLDFRLDGNGLTDKHVFSYWAEDDGTLEHNSLSLNEITKLKIGQDSSDAVLGGAWIKAENTDGDEITIVIPDLKNCQAKFITQLRKAIPSDASYSCKS